MLAWHSNFTFRDKSHCYTWIIPFSVSSLCVFSWRLLKRRSKMRNNTEIREFILLRLSDDPQLQVVIFVFLLITYMLSITGNLTIITLTLLDAHLQAPMYFFLRNFSLLEVSFTTVSIPRFLATIIIGDKTIPFNDCMAQLFFFSFSWESLSFILWLPCPMTVTLPSANCCITWPLWITKSAHCLSWPLGWLHS